MKIAFLTCRNAKHNCAGAADCVRMFQDRIGEFAPYGGQDMVAAVAQCDYCLSGEKSFDKYLAAWQSEKNHIPHVHLCACVSICPCGNYEKIKAYFSGHGMTLGEYTPSSAEKTGTEHEL